MRRGVEHFPRRERMRTHWEFKRVRQYGVADTGRFLVLSALRCQNAGTRRIGFIISNRLGNAVIRNRIRRRLREIYRLHRTKLDTGVWMVVIARKSAIKASYHEVERDFLQLYQYVMRDLPCRP